MPRRHQLYALATCAVLLLVAVNYLTTPSAAAAPRRLERIADPEQAPPKQQQIGGTTSWRRDDDVDNNAVPQPVGSTAQSTTVVIQSAGASQLRQRTLQCPTYAGPMYFPYSHPNPVKRKPVLVAALPTALEEQPTSAPGVRVSSLLPFELSATRLAPGSRFGEAQRVNAEFLRLLDTDRLLFFFRRLASLPQPKPDLVPYGGWESQGSGLRGEFVGHYLHAASAVAAASGDGLLRARCEGVVRALAECQSTDGYLSAFPQSEFAVVESFKSRAPWVPYYVLHKLLTGLLSA